MPQRVRKDSASSTTKRTVAEENHLAGVLSKEGIASGNDGDSSAGKKPLTDPIPFNHSTLEATTSKPTKASTSIRTPQRTRRPTTEAEPEPEPEPDPDDGLPVLPPLPTTRPKKVTSTTRRITDGDPGPSEEKETSTTEATSVWQGGSTRSEGLIIGPSDIRGKQPRKYKHMK
ncbi:hypothetical protein NECAME_08161 [Necator americanus]|uniref:Uncharacterized protein n=1 Tax=Necator americanus TaxID=51031 RepID=W2TLU7_NECAM|nr:hypothetical protein NECAME_08161 [Necator americanus]ETN82111.1 hypothetical protein NECAME_08161 [Necator americanus]